VEAALLGTAGGFMVALVDFIAKVDQWRKIREEAQANGNQRPKLGTCVDLSPQILAASLKILLGLAAGGIFGHTGLISDPAGAVAIGAAAPALLRRLGFGARDLLVHQLPRLRLELLAQVHGLGLERADIGLEIMYLDLILGKATASARIRHRGGKELGEALAAGATLFVELLHSPSLLS
jgi:hypothetical protein